MTIGQALLLIELQRTMQACICYPSHVAVQRVIHAADALEAPGLVDRFVAIARRLPELAPN